MKKFKYRVVSLVRNSLEDFNLTKFLDLMGEDGWELIHVSYTTDFREFIFKQEKKEGNHDTRK